MPYIKYQHLLYSNLKPEYIDTYIDTKQYMISRGKEMFNMKYSS